MKSFDSDFFIPFEISRAPFEISIEDRLILLGSCFADNIGRTMSENKFKVLVNPTGIIYNPFSIFKMIRDTVNDHIDKDRVIEREGIFYYLDAHSSISSPNKDELLTLLADQITVSRAWFLDATTVIFSFGTSYIYRYLQTNSIVANCHKIPGKEFSKTLLSVDDIFQEYFETMDLVRSINPDIKVIFTVSPVRHIKDGLVENNLSKSILILAIQKILDKDPDALYFPSYEIVIDVLRDYRFYKEDMIHPTDQAIQFIWKAFGDTCFDQKTLAFIEEWEKMRRAINHKPFHPNSLAHQKFLNDIYHKLLNMKDVVEVESELETISRQMKLS